MSVAFFYSFDCCDMRFHWFVGDLVLVDDFFKGFI